jgi:hypothetical protein
MTVGAGVEYTHGTQRPPRQFPAPAHPAPRAHSSAIVHRGPEGRARIVRVRVRA